MAETIGILHPGEMGISVAASAQNSGATVYWAAEGRSAQTAARAQRHALVDVHSLAALCQVCTTLISVCPPHAAEDVALQVSRQPFAGLYVDANAISPQRAERIGAMLAAHGIDFVDGGIIGGPAWEPGGTWLYLAGRQASRVAGCFSAGPLQAEVIGAQTGAASALKMCYAAYTKGTTALLTAILGAAEGLGVRLELERQWAREDGDFVEQTTQRVRRVTRKAWRFAGEMDEIADTFAHAGLPDGFHRSAGEVYRRLADYKDRESPPALEEVLAALLEQGE